MGSFAKRDPDGDNVVFTLDNNDNLLDDLGRHVSEKGYLIDQQGNIIDKNGKQLFPKECLLGNEFPKIFPFTKFNTKRIMGDFDVDVNSGKPILNIDRETGVKKDKKDRPCNNNGYLIDPLDNSIIDDRGNPVFNPGHLEESEH